MVRYSLYQHIAASPGPAPHLFPHPRHVTAEIINFSPFTTSFPKRPSVRSASLSPLPLLPLFLPPSSPRPLLSVSPSTRDTGQRPGGRRLRWGRVSLAPSVAPEQRGGQLLPPGSTLGFHHGEERQREARGVFGRRGCCRGAAALLCESRRLPVDGGGGVRSARRRVPRDLPADQRCCGGQVPGSRSAQ